MDEDVIEIVAEPVAAAAVEAPPSPPKITTAAEWRKAIRQRWILSLVSGMTVRAKAADVPSLLTDGVVSAEDLLALQQPTEDPSELRRRVDIARRVAAVVIEEPRIQVMHNGEVVPDDVVPAHEISPTDAIALLSWAMGNPTAILKVWPAEDAPA